MLKFPAYRRAKRRGISLVIVLASLVLLTILILAFLSSVGTELQTSKVYANGSSVRLLAQSAVSLVIGQIQTATSDQTLCWASQPGMIRTYDNTGAAKAYYKLYSDAAMQGTGNFDHTNTSNLVPTAWYNKKGVYIDLNQPVSVGSNNYYPIIDGNSSDLSYTYPSGTLGSGATGYGPAVGTLPQVQGFWLNSTSATNNPTPVDPSSPNQAPMPVMWLYVLQNGAVLVPDSGSTNGVVTFTNAANAGALPTASNPIVGRMAYWTDDETCKVNINTASVGANSNGTSVYGFNTSSGVTTGVVNSGSSSSFWDTPRSYTPQDFGYAYSQPVQNEFQRYPGHPAMVDLSVVLNGLTTDSGFPENVYNLTPRIIPGGSKEGTVSTVGATQTMTGTVSASLTGSLTLRSNRLYATLDEFLFQPTLSGTSIPGVGTRSLNSSLLSTSTGTTEINPALLEKGRFFLTANSEAPDVNLFNLPRVSMWPITLSQTSGAAAMTAYDQLIAYCATVNNHIYYFQRQDPTSPTTDLPTLAMESATGLGRNRELLEYVRSLTTQAIPGFGGNFAAKYGTPGDRDQILTEMFDYIRATNLQDSSYKATAYAQSYDNSASTTDPYLGGGAGQVVPIVDASTTVTDPVGGGTSNPRGFGRFPTVQQAALIFIGAGDSATQAPGTYTTLSGSVVTLAANADPNPPSSYTPPVASGSQRVQAGFFLQMYDPSQGVSIERPWYIIKVSNLKGLQWNGNSIFPTSATFPFCYNTSGIYVQPTAIGINYSNLVGLVGGNGFPGFSYGGVMDFRQQSLLRGSIQSGSWSTPSSLLHMPIYPYIGPPTGTSTYSFNSGPDLPSGSTFSFSQSGDVVVQIYALGSSWNSTTGTGTSTLVQTVNLKFPSGNFPVPYSIDNNQVNANPIPTYNNIPANTPTPTINGTYSASSYMPNTGTSSTFNATNTKLFDFLSFLDSYGSSTPIMGSAISGRLDFGSEQPPVTTCDVIRAIVASNPGASTTAATAGDMRLIAARQNVPDAFYQPITGTGFPTGAYTGETSTPPAYAAGADYFSSSNFFSHMLRFDGGSPIFCGIGGQLVNVSTTKNADYQPQYYQRSAGVLYNWGDSTYANRSFTCPADSDVANQGSGVVMGGSGTVPGDWDTGVANTRDGAYINKADEGDAGNPAIALSNPSDQNTAPYFELNYGTAFVGSTFFSPNRMIPSPGMFGSLPSQVWADKPWQTLLFRPGPAGHKGMGVSVSGSGDTGPPYTTPPDHLLMDLFNMPVVEPYAISSPLATAGRINMNYLIVPFTYINRDTGLRAVLKNQMITAIPDSVQATFKSSGNASGGAPSTTTQTRFSINIDATLSQFLARFNNTAGTQGANGAPDIFRSASEICNIDLIPNDTTTATHSYLATPITRANMDLYWGKANVGNGLTGDNLRERPYTNIYPLLTTKSNTFTVHLRVQTLKQVTGANASPSTWREGTDVVVGEYRGSQTIERYVDPNDTIPDYAGSSSDSGSIASQFPSSTPLSQYYKFRVVSTKQFSP